MTGLGKGQFADVCKEVGGTITDDGKCKTDVKLTPEEKIPFINNGNRYFLMEFERPYGTIIEATYHLIGRRK